MNKHEHLILFTIIAFCLAGLVFAQESPRRRAVSAGGTPFTGGSGTWQWVHQGGFNDAPAAYAYAASVSEHKPAIVIVTDDNRVPFVVFYWAYVDVWMPPAYFKGIVSGETDALVKYHYYKTIEHRRAGYTTLPDGMAIAWYTEE